ncbi:MAG: hypothetical protein DRQ13_10835 [Ignavibacteriae bacterium]|nr:MAG: hypothetical protein DRQ13_10835 [Ignavibacteriota bacterium]
MRKILLILLTLIVSALINAQTVLAPGDVALIAYQTDDPDRFAFVSLVDISESTTINFTDNSWDGIETGEATNDDFETGNLNNWALYTEAGNTIAFATDTVNNGLYSAKIS